MSRTQEKVLIKEFTPDYAGARVGWSSINELQLPDRTLYGVNLVSATVSKDGALLTSTIITDEDGDATECYSTDSSTGFEFPAAVGMTIIGGEKRKLELSSCDFSRANERDMVAGISRTMLYGVNHVSQREVSKISRNWGDNPSDVLEGLKRSLDQYGLIENYPAMYYLMNGHTGRAYQSLVGNFDDDSLSSFLLSDRSMSLTTSKEIEFARKVEANLYDIVTIDQETYTDLTVFSDLIPETVVEGFIGSRRRVAELEKRIAEVKDGMIVNMFSYLPISAVLTWPYMDPESHDDREAFGNEVDGLKNNNNSIAQYALSREARGMQGRLEYAAIGLKVLGALSALEAVS